MLRVQRIQTSINCQQHVSLCRALIDAGWTLADPLPDSPADTLQAPPAVALPRPATRRRQDPSDYTFSCWGWLAPSLLPSTCCCTVLASRQLPLPSLLGTYTSTLSLPPPAFSPCAATWIFRHLLPMMLVKHCHRRIPLDFSSRGAGLPYFLAGFPVPQATRCCAFLFLSFFLSRHGGHHLLPLRPPPLPPWSLRHSRVLV